MPGLAHIHDQADAPAGLAQRTPSRRPVTRTPPQKLLNSAGGLHLVEAPLMVRTVACSCTFASPVFPGGSYWHLYVRWDNLSWCVTRHVATCRVDRSHGRVVCQSSRATSSTVLHAALRWQELHKEAAVPEVCTFIGFQLLLPLQGPGCHMLPGSKNSGAYNVMLNIMSARFAASIHQHHRDIRTREW